MASPVFLLLLACSLPLVTSGLADMQLSISEHGNMSNGEAFSLTCLVVKGQYRSDDPFVWRKNYEILPGKTDGELQFAALDRSDTGMYDCGYNASGTVYYSRPFPLSFSYRPVVHISVSVNDVNDSSVPAGFDVFLTCNVTDSHPEVPEDKYRWWYSKTCQDKATDELQPWQKPSVLKLPRVKITDEGCYTCKAANEALLHNNASKMLHVSYLEYPCISVDPAVMEGDSTRVNCTVSSSPKATFALYKDGSLLRKVDGEGLLSHPISNVTLQDRGTYECRAINENINATKSVTTDLKIRHKPMACGNISSHFILVKAPIGTSVPLVVEFDANPHPTVEWRRVSPYSVVLDTAVHTHNSSVLTVRVEVAQASFSVKIFNEYGELRRQFEVEGVADEGTSPPAVSGETTTTIPEVSSAGSSGDGVGLGGVIGIVISGVIGVVIGLVVGFLLWKWKKENPAAPEQEEMRPMNQANSNNPRD